MVALPETVYGFTWHNLLCLYAVNAGEIPALYDLAEC